MLKQVLLELYDRDLNKLRSEIGQFAVEADLWKTGEGITNPAGNLCLHLCGNLEHFFGAVLGGTGYVRDRDAEFANKDVSREELLGHIDAAAKTVRDVLNQLGEEDLGKTYPLEVFERPMTTAFFLTHLATHFNYHLGQINYHRRLLVR